MHNDLAQRDFEATRMNQLWFGDIIVCLASGNLYLCSLEGTCSSPIVGYSLSEKMTADLAWPVDHATTVAGKVAVVTITQNWSNLASELRDVLALTAPPIAITFSETPPANVEAFNAPIAEATSDGRTGRVPAGCAFWTKSVDRTFSTVADDHGNCSVGSLVLGFKTLDEVAGNSDVATILETGWVTMDVVPQIPVIAEKPGAVTYGPLAQTPFDPDVVLLRVNGEQLMLLHDAIPDMHLAGKPQCHIVALAKDQGVVAASVGCALSRVRSGISPNEMTCAIPAAKVIEVLAALATTAVADGQVARYAADDALRFS